MSESNLLINPLPTGWNNYQFGEVCERVKDTYKPVEGGTTPYVGLEHLAQGFPAFVDCGIENDVKSSKTAFKIGDILFGKLRSYLRKGAQADFDGISSTDILVFRAKSRCESGFLKYLIHCDEFINHAKSTTSGVQHPRTSWSSLKVFHLSLFPLREQKKIAYILSTVQRAIEAQERIIQTTTELKKSLMHKLFTQGLSNEAQKLTEIGPVPESWEVAKIGTIAKIRSGGTPSRKNPAYWDSGDINWIKTGEINYSKIVRTEEKITKTGLEDSSAELFPAGTLLIAMYGQGVTRGKVAITGIEAATNQACAAIFPLEEVRTMYLYYFLKYNYDNIRNFAHGTNQKNLSADLIKSFPLAYPSKVKEQDQIADTLGIIDRKVSVARSKKSQLQVFFRTSLHELMTAKARIQDLQFSKQEGNLMYHIGKIPSQFSISIPEDEDGMIGRECPDSNCEGYFKIQIGTGLKGEDLPCHCPYCGYNAGQDQFFTQAQIEYAKSVVLNKVSDALIKDLRTMEFDYKPKGDFGIGFSMKVSGKATPIRYYREENLETEVICNKLS